MINHLYDRPLTRHTLGTIAQIIAAAQRIHQAVTSDRAVRLYKTIGQTVATIALLSIAAVLSLVDAGKAVHQWVQAHKDEDFNKLAADRVQAVAATVKVWLKGQRDRASILVQITAIDLEFAARAKVSRLGLLISEKALPVCGAEGCK